MGIFDFLKGNKEEKAEQNKREQEEQRKVDKITSQYMEEHGEADFVFEMEDAFQITGKGTVVTGKVLWGEARVGETVEVNTEKTRLTSRISGIESFRKTKEKAVKGEKVGLCLSDITQKQLQGYVTVTIRRS